ncbi:group 1 truncated hemoglobin [Porticoccaceae bacterium]|nr:group 1 truncated hemoglobin [Porticoccaceae bacterium]
MDNLFDKYGGVDVMRGLIKEFYAQVYARPALKKYFVDTDLEHLIDHQCKFFAYAMGKPFQVYEDEKLKEGHAGRAITEEHFLMVAELLRRVLLDAGVDNQDAKEIMIAVSSKRKHIVNV